MNKKSPAQKYARMHVKNVLIRSHFILSKLKGAKSLTDKSLVKDFIEKLHPVIPEQGYVRIGPDGDGGYVLPNDLDNIHACFSPGVGEFSGFEKQCASKGMRIYMADGSVEKPLLEDENFHFIKKFIGTETKGDVVTMSDWMAEYDTDKSKDLMLQMDIEGHEYAALSSMSKDHYSRFRVIVLEVHYLHQLWDKAFFAKAKDAFDKILEQHVCVHIHPNNRGGIVKLDGIEIPRLSEFTFLRKDRIKDLNYCQDFPNPFDQDNNKLPTVVLPKDWYRQELAESKL